MGWRRPETGPARWVTTGEPKVVNGVSASVLGPGGGAAGAVVGEVIGLFALNVAEAHFCLVMVFWYGYNQLGVL